MTTVYATNKTDVDRMFDALGNTTTYVLYDEIGNVRTERNPLSKERDLSYDYWGNTVDEEDFDQSVTHKVYDAVGRETDSYENWTTGTPGADQNVRTTTAYDEFGQAVTEVEDAGTTNVYTVTSYDLMGNKASETVYPDGNSSGGRTTTTVYGAAGLAIGSQGPIVPSDSGAPNCPDASVSGKCNTVTSVDMNGRASEVSNAYLQKDVTWFDFAGKPVQEIRNYVSGASATSERNVTTTSRYDAADHVISVTDALGRVTSTFYDDLDRVIKIVRPDTSWILTEFLPSGRVDRESKPTMTVGAEVWTKYRYDAAGRKQKTIEHFDSSGTARFLFAPFEGGTDSWVGSSSGFFTTGASSLTQVASDAKTGTTSLQATTTASAPAGPWLDLSGLTFTGTHTYRVRAWVKAPAGVTLDAYLGVDTSGGDIGTIASNVTATGGWQVVDGTWTPTANRSSNVHLAIRRNGTSPATLLIDDVVLWDASTAALNPQGYDWNVTTETVFDANGKVIESILPPADPATDAPMVTVTGYDDVGQVTSVRAPAVPTYPVAAKADTPIAYWRLDETSGTSATDASGNGRTLTISGGATLGGASAIDTRPGTSIAIDATNGKLQAAFNKTTWGLTGSTMSVEAWFSTSATSGRGTIIRNSHSGAGFWLARNGTAIEAAIYGSAQGLVSATGYQDGKWHHAIATADGSNLRLYIDGAQVGSTALSGTLNLVNDAVALGTLDTGGEAFSGSIDEVSLYAKALSADQVATHYAAGRSADLNLTTSYLYDGLGNRTDSTDAAGTTTHYGYDRRGNVTSSALNYVSGGSSTVTQNVTAKFAYNDRDEMTASCAPNVAATCNPVTPSTSAWRYAFDALGHITTETPPATTSGTAMSATTYEYDATRGGTRLMRTCDHPSGGSCTTASRYIDTGYDLIGRVQTVTHYIGASGSSTEKLKTVSTLDAAGQQTALTYWEATVQKDGLSFAYDDLGNQTVTTRTYPSTTTLTTSTFNSDATVATRIDHVISSTAATFGYDWRGLQITATSPQYTAQVTSSWRLDGLLAAKTWPTGTSGAAKNTAAYGYDRARRPVDIREKKDGTDQAQFTRTYDRAGNITSEGRTLTGVSGVSGTGIQSFTYDPLSRVISSSIPSGPSRAYTYDANSNRVTANDGTTTTTYAFNELDELVSQTISGVVRNFTYDGYGNMLTSAVATSGATTYTYYPQDRLTKIQPPTGNAINFTLDGLGRHWTKTVGAATDTYNYAGASEAVIRIAGSSTTDSVVDGMGNRLATVTGATFGWLLADIHGDIAASISAGSSTGATLTDAFRYDAYGMTLARYGTSPAPWRFQGRLLLNTTDSGTGGPGAVNTDLYDFVARAYDPALGAFTSFDSVRGQAQNPISLNRFLYAFANPESLIDPDGHWPWDDAAKIAGNVGSFAQGFGEGVVGAAVSGATGIFEMGKAAVGATVNAGGCAISTSCRNKAIASAVVATKAFARDPGGTIRRTADAAGNALGAAVKGAQDLAASTVDRVGTAWKTGNFRELGRIDGRGRDQLRPDRGRSEQGGHGGSARRGGCWAHGQDRAGARPGVWVAPPGRRGKRDDRCGSPHDGHHRHRRELCRPQLRRCHACADRGWARPDQHDRGRRHGRRLRRGHGSGRLVSGQRPARQRRPGHGFGRRRGGDRGHHARAPVLHARGGLDRRPGPAARHARAGSLWDGGRGQLS